MKLECRRCWIKKDKSEFSKGGRGRGLHYWCKECIKEYDRNRYHTKIGLCKTMYKGQKYASKKRGHSLPSYEEKELIEWVFRQPNFEELFNKWKESNFHKSLKPSCDRINDSEGYSFDNIRLVTWRVNNLKQVCKTGEAHCTSKPKDYYANKCTTRGSFKRSCRTNGWDFDAFIETFCKWYINPNNGHRAGMYIYVKMEAGQDGE